MVSSIVFLGDENNQTVKKEMRSNSEIIDILIELQRLSDSQTKWISDAYCENGRRGFD